MGQLALHCTAITEPVLWNLLAKRKDPTGPTEDPMQPNKKNIKKKIFPTLSFSAFINISFNLFRLKTL